MDVNRFAKVGLAICYQGQIAQLVEHGPEKAGVGGSSPPLSTFEVSLFCIESKKPVASEDATGF